MTATRTLAEELGSEDAAVDALRDAFNAEEITQPEGDPHAAALLAAALAYAPCTVPLEGKRPTIREWPNWAATPEAIREWWAGHPRANVGIRTGNGLVVLDIDPRAGGDDVLADLEHEHGELPATVECRTGGGGRHLYLRGPHDLTSFDLGAGVEVKAAGRQVVAPPSVHPTTFAIYEWEPGHAPGDLPRADLPAWVTAGRQERRERPSRTPTSEWVALVRDGLTDGQRNQGVAHLLAKDVDAYLAAELAHLVNERNRPPLEYREVDNIVQSIAGRELHRRKGGAR
jgi:hypothetical protein